MLKVFFHENVPEVIGRAGRTSILAHALSPRPRGGAGLTEEGAAQTDDGKEADGRDGPRIRADFPQQATEQ